MEQAESVSDRQRTERAVSTPSDGETPDALPFKARTVTQNTRHTVAAHTVLSYPDYAFSGRDLLLKPLPGSGEAIPFLDGV